MSISTLLPGMTWETTATETTGHGGGLVVSIFGADVQFIASDGSVDYDRAESPADVDRLIRARLRSDRADLVRQIAAIDTALSPGVAPGQLGLFGGVS
jgi:hypothetical protein